MEGNTRTVAKHQELHPGPGFQHLSRRQSRLICQSPLFIAQVSSGYIHPKDISRSVWTPPSEYLSISTGTLRARVKLLRVSNLSREQARRITDTSELTPDARLDASKYPRSSSSSSIIKALNEEGLGLLLLGNTSWYCIGLTVLIINFRGVTEAQIIAFFRCEVPQKEHPSPDGVPDPDDSVEVPWRLGEDREHHHLEEKDLTPTWETDPFEELEMEDVYLC